MRTLCIAKAKPPVVLVRLAPALTQHFHTLAGAAQNIPSTTAIFTRMPLEVAVLYHICRTITQAFRGKRVETQEKYV